jgi:hypothetical protein
MARRNKTRAQEHFARVPISVLESEAVTTLNHAAFKVLVVLAAGYRGTNNGTLALTGSFAKRFGLKGRDTLYRSLRELERRGLIVCTRRGFKSKKMFTLYAVGWESITHREGQPLDIPEPKNNSRWLKWSASVPMAGTHELKQLAQIHTDGRDSSVPIVGTDDPVSVPMVYDRSPISIPMAGHTSRVLAGARSASAPRPVSGCHPQRRPEAKAR